MQAWSWSDNMRGHEPELIAADDFDVKERAFPFEDSDHPFITVTPKGVTFNMQRGPIREVGVPDAEVITALAAVDPAASPSMCGCR